MAVISGQEPCSEMLRTLTAKDESQRSLQSSLEAERRQRRQLQAMASAERASLQERFRQVEGELQHQLQVQQADMEERREALHAETARLAEQLKGARCREAELLVKNGSLADDLRRLLVRSEADAAELLALRARAEALAAELSEAHSGLKLSDEVRSGLFREAKDKDAALEQLRAEKRELELLERAGREQSAAQYERLNAQAQAMTRQAEERGREALVLENRCQLQEENLRTRGLEHERALGEADERRKEVEARLARVEEEAGALRDELRAKALTEGKLKEAIAGHEVHIEDHKKEEQRLRQELFRQQAASDEKDLAIQAGKNREQHLATTQATLEERLRTTVKESEDRQTSLFAARDRCQTLELELQGARDAAAALREEISRVRAAGEAQRLEETRRLEEKVAQREAESALLQTQLGDRREELCQQRGELDRGSVDLASVRGELAVALAGREAEIKSRDEAAVRAQRELVAARDARDEIEAVLAQVRRELEAARADASRTAAALAEARAAAEASQVRAEALEEKIMSWRPPVLSEEGVQTSPRILPPASPWFPEGQVWGSEMAALHRSVETLQAMVHVGPPEEVAPLPPPIPTISAIDPGRTDSEERLARQVVCNYMDRHLETLHRRLLLADVWQSWLARLDTSTLRAQLEMAIADENQIARECNARAPCPSAALAPAVGDSTDGCLRRLLLEFRQRLMAAVADMLSSTSGDARALLVENLERGRRCFGRMFHAAFFFYQKVRAFVPGELEDTLHDPLSRLVPFPFYVLPYKGRHALDRGLAALTRGGPRARPRSASPPKEPAAAAPPYGGAETREDWFRRRIAELEEALPLASSSKFEVPHFLARLMQCRALVVDGTADAQGFEEEAPFRDRFDVLLADAFTVYMSAWRATGSSTPGGVVQSTLRPDAASSPYAMSQSRRSSSQRPRLGTRRGA